VLERLQILVDGNAQGAIREFQKVGAAADRELGRTEDRLLGISNKLTSFGTGLLAGGAVAITGLKQFADSASAYGEQVSAATVIFGEDGAKQLETFAEAAADTANVSKTEATKAANGFATFARQAGLTGTAAVEFSTNLVQLAGDLSSFRDISVQDALQALQSGLAGEGEPIRRLGGDISDVALKAEYLAVTGEAVTGTMTQQQKVVAINSKLFKDFDLAQGDVLRTQDSLAGQTRNAQANFENLKTEIGEGLVPIFASVVGGINDVIGKFQELPDSTKGTVGTVAGLAAFGTTAVGALSLLAGQAIKFRDVFTNTTTTVVSGVETTNRSLSRLGRVAIGTAAITGLLALNSVLKDAQVNTGRLQKTTDDLVAAKTDELALDALLQGTRELDSWWDDFVEAVGPGIGDVVDINGFTTEIEDLRERLSQLEPEPLEKALSALKNATVSESLLSSPFAIDNLRSTIAEFEGQLGSAKAAQEAQNEELANGATASGELAGAVGGVGSALDGTQPAVEEFTVFVEGLAVKTTEADNAFKNYAETLKANTDPFFAVVDAANGFGDAQTKVSEAFKALFTDGATPDEFRDYADAQRDAVEAGLDLEGAIAGLRSEVEDGNIAYGDAITTLENLERKYPQLRDALKQVKDEFFFAALAAQGLNEEAPIELPVNASTEDAVAKLEAVRVGIEAIGIAAEAIRLSDLFTRRVQNNADNRNDIGFQEVVGNRDLNGNGIIGRQFGGPVDRNRPYVVGEAGPELFVPRTSGKIVPNNQLQSGTLNLTQNITTPDPVLTAAEVVRRQRDAEFLAGV
jgi:hypothetical protein